MFEKMTFESKGGKKTRRLLELKEKLCSDYSGPQLQAVGVFAYG